MIILQIIIILKKYLLKINTCKRKILVTYLKLKLFRSIFFVLV